MTREFIRKNTHTHTKTLLHRFYQIAFLHTWYRIESKLKTKMISVLKKKCITF